jgi:hypothetical protein
MKFLDEQDKHIMSLTQAIDARSNLSDVASLHLFNERGIIYLFTGQLENAVNDFNHVIENLTSDLPLEKKILGTALWGRMLCHAFSSQLNNTCNDSSLISSLFDKCTCHESREKNLFIPANCNDHLMILPIAKFAYPEEKISKWECHDRTDRIAGKMRSLAELIPLYVVRQAVLWTIDRQSQKAHKCCENGNHWTECLGPIADVWKKLENTWDELVDLFDKGINIDLFLTSPSNL